MLYSLFRYLDLYYDIPGSGMFQYISFRAAVAVILALLITIFFGRSIIRALQRHQIGEEIRDLGLEGQLSKKGTPTMGGVIILLAVLVPVLLVGRLDNVYVLLMLVSAVWLGFIGFLDDYIKTFRHKKEGLKGKFKVVGQVGLGIIVGIGHVLLARGGDPRKGVGAVGDDIRRRGGPDRGDADPARRNGPHAAEDDQNYHPVHKEQRVRLRLDRGRQRAADAPALHRCGDLRGDGRVERREPHRRLDGLLTTVSVPIVMVLGVLAYLSGHIIYADYLNIMYIPDSSELVVFAAACAAR